MKRKTLLLIVSNIIIILAIKSKSYQAKMCRRIALNSQTNTFYELFGVQTTNRTEMIFTETSSCVYESLMRPHPIFTILLKYISSTKSLLKIKCTRCTAMSLANVSAQERLVMCASHATKQLEKRQVVMLSASTHSDPKLYYW